MNFLNIWVRLNQKERAVCIMVLRDVDEKLNVGMIPFLHVDKVVLVP